MYEYRPPNFDNELRKYQIIHKAPFEKKFADFDDYQHWFRKDAQNEKRIKHQQITKLVDRLNPTNRSSIERAKDDTVWNEIVEKVQSGVKIQDVRHLKSA